MNSGPETKISIQCDNCGTKYRVHRSRFSEKVSKVKCTKCNAIFKIEEFPVQSPQDSAAFEELQRTSTILTDAEKACLEVTRQEKGETNGSLEGHSHSVHQEISDEEADSLFRNDKENSGSFSFTKADSNPLQGSQSVTPAVSVSVPTRISGNSASTNTSSELSHDFSFKMPESPLSVVEETVKPQGIDWGRKTVALMTLMVAFATLLGASIYLLLKEPFLLDYFFNPAEFPVHFVGELDSKQVENISNRQTLFVVEGKLQNLLPTSDQVSWIQLKGLAFDKNREIIETAVVYAGNVATEQEISSWSLEKIKNFYTYNSGRESANFKLNKNQVVPFQMTFFESAEVIKNVTIRPVSYVRRNKIEYIRGGVQ